MYFGYFCYLLSLDKGVALCFNKVESPSPKYEFVPSLVESGSGEEDENVINLWTDGQQTTGHQKSFLKLSVDDTDFRLD